MMTNLFYWFIGVMGVLGLCLSVLVAVFGAIIHGAVPAVRKGAKMASERHWGSFAFQSVLAAMLSLPAAVVACALLFY
jgi:hypothetical protein